MNWKNVAKVTAANFGVCIPIVALAAYLGAPPALGFVIGLVAGFTATMYFVSRWPID